MGILYKYCSMKIRSWRCDPMQNIHCRCILPLAIKSVQMSTQMSPVRNRLMIYNARNMVENSVRNSPNIDIVTRTRRHYTTVNDSYLLSLCSGPLSVHDIHVDAVVNQLAVQLLRKA